MNVILPRLLIAAGIIGAAVLFWVFFTRDDVETIINQRLNEAIALVEVTGDESPFLIIGQSRELTTYLSSEPRLNVGRPLPEMTDRNEMTGIVAQARQTLSALSVRVVSRSIEVAGDQQSAVMDLTADATFTMAGERARERRSFRLEWVLENNDWLISKVDLTDIESGSGLY